MIHLILNPFFLLYPNILKQRKKETLQHTNNNLIYLDVMYK